MAEKALNSADELNIDSFFREQSGKDTVADESEEGEPDTSQEAPDQNKPDKKSKKRSDEDSDNDIDLEEDEESDDEDEDDDSEEDEDDLDDDEDLSSKKKKKDGSKGLDALRKQAENAEAQRKQMQSERDSFKAETEKANSKIDSLSQNVEQLTKLVQKLTKKAEQSESSEFFTGDDDALMTEGQIKKLLERQAKSQKSDYEAEETGPLTEKRVKELLEEQAKALKESSSKGQEQQKIGSDAEAQRFWGEAQDEWVNSQPDAEEVGSYYMEHKAALDPELATIPTTKAGHYAAIRAKKMEAELKSAKKALRKAKQKLKRVEKGELPETASNSGAKPKMKDNSRQDPIDKFFAK